MDDDFNSGTVSSEREVTHIVQWDKNKGRINHGLVGTAKALENVLVAHVYLVALVGFVLKGARGRSGIEPRLRR